MAVSLCGYQGCRNPVKKDATACWRHDGLTDNTAVTLDPQTLLASKETLDAIGGDLNVLVVPPPGTLTPTEMGASLIAGGTPIDPELAEPVTRAVEHVSRRRDLSIPMEASQHIEDSFEDFVAALQREGVSRNRMTVLQVSGFNRRLLSGREQSGPDVVHEAVVLDRGTDREVVVDPFLSMFAPVQNNDSSVDGQLPSGSTPFGDVPWVGTVGQYVGGDYMWWDRWSFARFE